MFLLFGAGHVVFFCCLGGGRIFLFTLFFAHVKFSGVCAGCLDTGGYKKNAWIRPTIGPKSDQRADRIRKDMALKVGQGGWGRRVSL